MAVKVQPEHDNAAGNAWLKRYYFVRATFSFLWVAAVLTLPAGASAVVGALLVVYPAWDAAANLVDARRNGGMRHNRTQALNTAVSTATAVAVAIALSMSMNAVLGVFGVWASLAGLLQLATAVRRWKSYGAQWPMALSGGQSAVVGVMFLKQANAPELPGVSTVAGYAAFGAIYFVASALFLVVSDRRRRNA